MSQLSDPDPFEFVDIPRHNPWWDDPDALPTNSLPRTDLYWRVRNVIENDLVLIPGASITGTNATLQQVIRALLLGAEHEKQNVRELFEEGGPGEAIGKDGCDPRQLCRVSCSDPLAHLVEDFIASVRKEYHTLGAQTGSLDLYLFIEDVHRLNDWADQLAQTHRLLEEEFPENWTIVGTVPMADMVYDSELVDVEECKIDRPHHTQKFRDTLFSHSSQLQATLEPDDAEQRLVDTARKRLREAATDSTSAKALEESFRTLSSHIRNEWKNETFQDVLDQYLTEGGFAPAITGRNAKRSTDGAETYPPDSDQIAIFIERGITDSIYRDLPRVSKVESSTHWIESPEDLHAMIAYLSRRDYEETSYKSLAEFLSCDPRTIKNKFLPVIEGLHIGERSTRYDLQRERTVRFYPRSPGYLTAYRGERVSDADRSDRLRITLADHLRRLLAKYDSDRTLQYWRDDDYLVDFIITIDGTPVPFISAFADENGGTIEAFDAFAESVEQHSCEVVMTETDGGVSVTNSEGVWRVIIPHWVVLSIC